MTPYPLHHVNQQNFRDRLLEFVIGGGMPFDVVEGYWFRRLISSLDPKLTVPSASTIVNKLTTRHNLTLIMREGPISQPGLGDLRIAAQQLLVKEVEALSPESEVIEIEKTQQQPPPKKSRLSIFEVIKSRVVDKKKASSNEVAEYILQSDILEPEESSPLQFWSPNSKKFPALSELARRIFKDPSPDWKILV